MKKFANRSSARSLMMLMCASLAVAASARADELKVDAQPVGSKLVRICRFDVLVNESALDTLDPLTQTAVETKSQGYKAALYNADEFRDAIKAIQAKMNNSSSANTNKK